MMKENELTEDDVMSFNNTNLLMKHINEFNNKSTILIDFKISYTQQVNIDYTIFYNNTVTNTLWGEFKNNYLNEAHLSLINAIAKVSLGKEDEKDRIINFRHKEANEDPEPTRESIESQKHTNKATTVFISINIFISLGFLFNWILYGYKINSEKNDSMRFLMTLMGMKSSAYWLSSLTSNYFINLVSFGISYLVGYLLKIEFFTQTSPFVIISIFLVYMFSLLIMAMFLTTIISNITIFSKS
jgi:hypothetical protein